MLSGTQTAEGAVELERGTNCMVAASSAPAVPYRKLVYDAPSHAFHEQGRSTRREGELQCLSGHVTAIEARHRL